MEDSVACNFNNFDRVLPKLFDMASRLGEIDLLSLVFLLIDNNEEALKVLQDFFYRGTLSREEILLRCINLANPNWEEALLEALFLIQNNREIVKLGYGHKDERLRNLLCCDSYKAKYIHSVKKVLYIICDSLHVTEESKLLSNIAADFPAGIVVYPQLEMNLLYWHKIGYISLSGNVNLSKLIPQLVRINLPRDLLLAVQDVVRESQEISNEGMKEERVERPMKTRQCGMRNDTKPGLCVLVNQKNFDKNRLRNLVQQNNQMRGNWTEKQLERWSNRLGTDIDRDTLAETFTMFGCEIRMVTNAVKDQILRLPETIDGHKYSFFVICICSHGEDGGILDRNWELVDINDLKKVFSKRDGFIGKVKIFVVQACQKLAMQKVVYKPECAVRPDGAGTSEDNRPDGAGTSEDNRLDGAGTSEDNRADGAGTSEDNRPDGASTSEDNRPDGESKSEDNRPDGESKSEDNRPDGTGTSEDNRPDGDGTSEDNRPDGAGTSEDNRPDGASTSEDNRPDGAGTSEDSTESIDFVAVRDVNGEKEQLRFELAEREHISCDGGDLRTDGADNRETYPEYCDFFVFRSTVEGYASFRDEFQGSWFIQELCNVLVMNPGVDLLLLARETKRAVRQKRSPEAFAQVPKSSDDLDMAVQFTFTKEGLVKGISHALYRYIFYALVDEFLSTHRPKLLSMIQQCLTK